MAAFFSDMTGVGFMTRITATRSLGSGAATGSTRSHFDLRQFGAALLLTAATVGEDIFQHGQHVVFRSVLRGFIDQTKAIDQTRTARSKALRCR
jgi:hypothetical protein